MQDIGPGRHTKREFGEGTGEGEENGNTLGKEGRKGKSTG